MCHDTQPAHFFQWWMVCVWVWVCCEADVLHVLIVVFGSRSDHCFPKVEFSHTSPKTPPTAVWNAAVHEKLSKYIKQLLIMLLLLLSVVLYYSDHYSDLNVCTLCSTINTEHNWNKWQYNLFICLEWSLWAHSEIIRYIIHNVALIEFWRLKSKRD